MVYNKTEKSSNRRKAIKSFFQSFKEITIAVKEGGGSDPDGNPRLRMAINNAKGVNLPKENLERAIKKAGDKDSASLAELTYEGYAPNGIAVFLECTTDNINRTVSNVRALFTKHGGTLGTNGSLEFIFDRKGVFTIPANGLDEDEFTLEVIDGGADDVVKEDDVFMVYTPFDDFGNMQKKLDDMNIQAENAELQRIPNTTKPIALDQSKKVLRLIEQFEEDDDVQNVFHNLEITDELLQEI